MRVKLINADPVADGSGVPQKAAAIFLRDPNNVEIELNFETKNEMAA